MIIMASVILKASEVYIGNIKLVAMYQGTSNRIRIMAFRVDGEYEIPVYDMVTKKMFKVSDVTKELQAHVSSKITDLYIVGLLKGVRRIPTRETTA
jgi:hypothetical protein